MVPEHLKYGTTHEWCLVEGQAVTVGVTEQAITPLGQLIYVELPEVGDDVLVEIPFGEIQGVEAVKDLMSPVDGVVEEVNTRVAHRPELLKKDPYGEGWLIRLKSESPAALDELLSAADYEQFVRSRKGK